MNLNPDSWHFGKKRKKKNLIVATHGFIKKMDKVPENEIDRAMRTRERYFEEKWKK